MDIVTPTMRYISETGVTAVATVVVVEAEGASRMQPPITAQMRLDLY